MLGGRLVAHSINFHQICRVFSRLAGPDQPRTAAAEKTCGSTKDEINDEPDLRYPFLLLQRDIIDNSTACLFLHNPTPANIPL